MKQSNTSHNKVSFGGVLEPLLDVLKRSAPEKGRLMGQEVSMPKKGIEAFIALDDKDNIHLLIAPAPANDSIFSKFDFKGLKINNNQWAVANRPVQDYLDISCSTGTLSSFKRPFLSFAEDVLFEMSQSKGIPYDAVRLTCIRWKKFWSEDSDVEIRKEWIHGIFGELLFLNDMMERFGLSVIDSWTGPMGKDHDFQTGTKLAAEVKTSVEVPFSIQCNIRQLDPALFKLLYIVCYHLKPAEEGTALPDMVKKIERMIGEDEIILDKFHDRLISVGYKRQAESAYNEIILKYAQADVYEVDDNFPKIIETSFISPPDHRIRDIRYKLQLTGVKKMSIDEVVRDLALFGK